MTITGVEETLSKLLSLAHIQLLEIIRCKIEQQSISHHDSKVNTNKKRINVEVQFGSCMYSNKEPHQSISDWKKTEKKQRNMSNSYLTICFTNGNHVCETRLLTSVTMILDLGFVLIFG